MRPYSMDLRLKVLAALDRGRAAAAVAGQFGLTEKTVRRYRRRRDEGRLAPDKCGPPPVPTKLAPDDVERMRREVEARPGVTLRELAALIGGKVVESTVCRCLLRLGYRHKKRRWWPASAAATTCGDAAPASPWPAGSSRPTGSCSSTRRASGPT